MKNLLRALIALVVLCAFSFIIGWSHYSARGAPKTTGAIGGKVQVSHGGSPAGVWVIAETDQVLINRGSPGQFRKIVVTDDHGNFLIPDLPSATYNVFVRGYGLVDSTPVPATPGQNVTLHADPASSPQEAAQVYPASFWFSLFHPPDKSLFPGTGTNGIPVGFQSQDQWIAQMKGGCNLCHQVGNADTRDLTTPTDWSEAWNLAATMSGTANGLGRSVSAIQFANWGNSIVNGGAVPPTPPRPQGIERNVVITQWEWGDQFTYAHDEIATDKRNPELYPFGKVYAVDLGNDYIVITDPVTNVSSRVKVPTLNGFSTPWCNQTFNSPTTPNGFCTWNVYVNPANPHNPMLDDTGKLWFTSQIRREWTVDFPPFCDSVIIGNNDRRHHRQLAYLDTKTNTFVLIDTCYGTHHLEFADDGKLWVSGDSFVIGMFDPSKFDPNNSSTLASAEKWFEQIDHKTGQTVYGFIYGINPNPVDGSIWGATPSAGGEGAAAVSNRIIRLDPSTGFMNNYPLPPPGRVPRGVDVTRGLGTIKGGLVFFGTGSGHLGRFDRSKCADPTSACPEGFTFWQSPGPKFPGTGSETGSTDMHYLIWVDQFNAAGLGNDIVYLTGTTSDSIHVFDPATEKFIATIRMPFPLGFFHRGLDARIDNPNTGWKGRGIWIDYGIDPLKHVETQMGQICHVQVRPTPLSN